MKFGIIGTGSIGHTHAAAIQHMDGSTLHSVYHRHPKSPSPWPGVKTFSNLAEFLADPELEIVTIATPSGAHLEPTLAALQAGKHVICEKPLEISTARIDTLIAAAATSGKTLAAILNRRFHPAMDAFKAACTADRFGQITSASCYIKWFRDQAYYDSAAWRGTWALDGGGVLMNQGIHAIDSLLHLAGPVRSVQARTSCLAHERIEVEDSAVALLTFENGALGVIEGSTCAWSHGGHPARLQITGTEGSAFLADESFEVWDFKNECSMDAAIRRDLMGSKASGLGANDPKRSNSASTSGTLKKSSKPSTKDAHPAPQPKKRGNP
jgi:UDP-N-acetyl-2-amino-2-deoxyglucuronate dehydrogenase